MKRSSGLLFILLLVIIMGFGVVLAGGIKSVNQQPNYRQITPIPNGSTVGTSLDTSQKNAKPSNTGNSTKSSDQNLQLKDFGYVTPSPVPTVVPTIAGTDTPSTGTSPVILIGGQQPGKCGPDSERINCTCPEPYGMPIDYCPITSNLCSGQPEFVPYHVSLPSHTCRLGASEGPPRAGCKGWCVAKPVIYLYPEKDTLVDVSIRTPGKIVISNPVYPEDGWQNVLAHPDGTLLYQNHQYAELFYETAPDVVHEPTNGIVIAQNQLPKTLRSIITQLGLTTPEQDEFLSFWLPRLQKLHSPYIFFSILDPLEKERTDHVRISPKPDTMIAFIAFFKPMKTKFSTKPTLLLPKKPERRGFTAVEWGGTIDPTSLD